MADTLIKRAGNRALQTNPPNADIHLGRWGSDWAWTVFCVMALTTPGLLAWSAVVPKNRRTFHYLLIATLAVSSIAWWTMASDLGATPITVQFLRNSPFGSGYGGFPTRQIFYARYIDWFITTPLLLLSLLLITGMPLSLIFITLFFNQLMIVCGLLGVLTRTRYKWGYYVFALAALGYVLYHIFASGLRSARRLGSGFGRAFLAGSALLATIWPMYALCWALSEGGNVIGVSEEMLWYGILDLISKPLFALLLLSMLRKCDYSALRLRSGKVSERQIDQLHNRSQVDDKAREGVGAAPAHPDSASAAPLAPAPPSHAVPPTSGAPQTMMTPTVPIA